MNFVLSIVADSVIAHASYTAKKLSDKTKDQRDIQK